MHIFNSYMVRANSALEIMLAIYLIELLPSYLGVSTISSNLLYLLTCV